MARRSPSSLSWSLPRFSQYRRDPYIMVQLVRANPQIALPGPADTGKKRIEECQECGGCVDGWDSAGSPGLSGSELDTVAPVFRGDAEEAARACVARSKAQCCTQARSARGSRFPFYCLRGAPVLRATAALRSQKRGAQRPTLESHPWRRPVEILQLIFPQLRGISSLLLEAKNHGTSTSRRASVQSNRRIKF